MKSEAERVKALESKLEKAYASAYRLAYSKEDFLAAKPLLEAALQNFKAEITNERLFKIKVLQADIYFSLNQLSDANDLLNAADHIHLTIEEKESLKEFRQRLKELKTELK